MPLSVGGLRPNLTYNFWAHASLPPHGISIGLTVFAGLTVVAKRQTDRQTDDASRSVATGDVVTLCARCGSARAGHELVGLQVRVTRARSVEWRR